MNIKILKYNNENRLIFQIPFIYWEEIMSADKWQHSLILDKNVIISIKINDSNKEIKIMYVIKN